MSIYKACDIRGEFGKELTVAHAAALGHALVRHTRAREVLVAGDARLSTPALKTALSDALVASGARVLDLGAAPTPLFYFARRTLGAPVGVMVTASHNPAPDNGFKIVLGELPITLDELDALRVLMQGDARADAPTRGSVAAVDVTAAYCEFIARQFPTRGALEVVIDAGNGMYGVIAPRVLRALGYAVDELFTEIDGRFPNRPPNPAVAANLAALSARVRARGAALGIAYDGDGDRAAFVDERGEPLDNDRAIVLFARAALTQTPSATIVYDQKCSELVRQEILRGGGTPQIEKSGHTFIKSAFLKTRAAYAGELSGHHFFAGLGGDDGLFASLRLAEIVQASGQTLGQLADALPRYPITPDLRVRVAPGEGDVIIAAVRANVRGATEIVELDGVRAQFADGWGMVRASVTEPALTLRFEGHTPAALERIKREFMRAAPQLEGKI